MSPVLLFEGAADAIAPGAATVDDAAADRGGAGGTGGGVAGRDIVADADGADAAKGGVAGRDIVADGEGAGPTAAGLGAVPKDVELAPGGVVAGGLVDAALALGGTMVVPHCTQNFAPG